MKSHYTVEYFFHERFRAHLGVVLALLRVAFAYAITQGALCAQSAVPEALTRLKVQVVPFLEVIATAWNMAGWRAVLLIAGVALGLGLCTRIAAGVLLIFFVGMSVIDYEALIACMGSWTGVAGMLLAVALFSEWGRVFGLDEGVRRLGLFAPKHKKSGLFF